MDDRKRYLCVCGPFHGQCLWLNTRSTAMLIVRGMVGRYVADKTNKFVRWEDAQCAQTH